MRLEPRVDKLEATVSNDAPSVTRIELCGHPNGPIAVTDFNGAEWTPITMAAQRNRRG